MRWVRLFFPTNHHERQIFPDPWVMDEAPKGVGREVRLATEQETGVFGLRHLPRSPKTLTTQDVPGDENAR